MKTSTIIALTAAALLSGVSVASASTVKPRAEDTINLNGTQQKTAWNDMSHAANQNAPAGFNAAAGSKLPNTVAIKAVPNRLQRDVSPLRPYDFAKVDGKLLIVNPSDRMIADVISG
jgi:hypothetical protein